MITREYKLKPNKKQEVILTEWLWICTGIYNFGIRKIENYILNPSNWKYYTKLEFLNLCANHSKKLGMPSHSIQGMLGRSFDAWVRHWQGLGERPRLKGVRNKVRSIPFPDPIPAAHFSHGKVRIPGLGRVRFHKQDLPAGKILNGRVLRRASGWYLQVVIAAKHTFPVQNTNKQIGIDTGFMHLAVLSDGEKIENPRNYCKAQKRLGQAQRGRRNKLVARLHERIANRRKDHNHKAAKKIVQNYAGIYITKDNLRGQAKKFGKSVGDAGISQLRNFIAYKSENHGRRCVFVEAKNTTKTCSACGALTGPTGLRGLSERHWECAACGAVWDRDINSALVILNAGVGRTLKGDSDDSK